MTKLFTGLKVFILPYEIHLQQFFGSKSLVGVFRKHCINKILKLLRDWPVNRESHCLSCLNKILFYNFVQVILIVNIEWSTSQIKLKSKNTDGPKINFFIISVPL